MSLYIRLQTSFWTHRKTMRLKAAIGADALWLVPRLWSYAAENQPDGDFSNYSPAELAMLLGYPTDAQAMLAALQVSGFMDEMKVHGWEEHNSYHSVFATRAKKAADARWRKTEKRMPKTGEERIRKDKSQALLDEVLSNASSIGLELGPDLQSKITEWIDYRIKGAKPKDGNWSDFFKRQIKWLHDHKTDAVEIIDTSLRNGYTGLFELKNKPTAKVVSAQRIPSAAEVYGV